MGAYSFKEFWEPMLLDGSKTHTIRARRRNYDRPGSAFYGFIGQRTPRCRRVVESQVVRVESIVIRATGEMWLGPFVEQDERGKPTARDLIRFPETYGLGKLTRDECEQLARRDGFRTGGLAEMLGFWSGRLPFFGDVIHWRPER